MKWNVDRRPKQPLNRLNFVRRAICGRKSFSFLFFSSFLFLENYEGSLFAPKRVFKSLPASLSLSLFWKQVFCFNNLPRAPFIVWSLWFKVIALNCNLLLVANGRWAIEMRKNDSLTSKDNGYCLFFFFFFCFFFFIGFEKPHVSWKIAADDHYVDRPIIKNDCCFASSV